MSLEELEDFLRNFPDKSVCDRANKEKVKQYYLTRLAENINGSDKIS